MIEAEPERRRPAYRLQLLAPSTLNLPPRDAQGSASVDMGVPQVIMAPVGEHSAKPGEVHRRIERVLAMPYLELFARAKRPGWVTWGNEVPFAADRHCRLVFAEVCYRCGALATLATLEVWE